MVRLGMDDQPARKAGAAAAAAGHRGLFESVIHAL